MARTKIVIIYGKLSKIMRRVNVPDDDSQIGPQLAAISPGEASIAVDWTQGTLQEAAALLSKTVGPPVFNDLFAVVDEKGLVTSVIHCDPIIDAAPDGHSFIATADGTGVGDTWDGRQFMKPPPPDAPFDLLQSIDTVDPETIP